MAEEKEHPYRVAGEVENLSSLEERALTLAERLEKFPEQYTKWPTAVLRYEKQILDLLKEAGFKKTYHCHFVEPYESPGYFYVSCFTGFLRDTSIVLTSFTTPHIQPLAHKSYRKLCSKSGLYVIPRGKEILYEIKDSCHGM